MIKDGCFLGNSGKFRLGASKKLGYICIIENMGVAYIIIPNVVDKL